MRQFTNFKKPASHQFSVNHLDVGHRQRFYPGPAATGDKPYRLDLRDVLSQPKYDQIIAEKAVMFHAVGDTGGVAHPAIQQSVATRMAKDLMVTDPKRHVPSFFYHLGDVVYYYGQTSDYYAQFYDPYVYYDAPIFAIPGNHDGDVDPGEVLAIKSGSLDGFVNNFCQKTPVHVGESGDSGRMAMNQPNYYWTLETPYATIVGLYTNVPEGGQIDVDQATWLAGELTAAPKDKALIVTCHHPPYSADIVHGGSQYMLKFLDTTFKATGVVPHLILSGHCHNYQRFERTLDKSVLPYIVAGAGGYWNLARLPKIDGGSITVPYVTSDPTVVLKAYNDTRHGFLRLMVTPTKIFGEYVSVADTGVTKAELSDAFTFRWQDRQMETV